MSVKVVVGKHTGQPRGTAFVEMSTQWEARKAPPTLNRAGFMETTMLVKEAAEKRRFGRKWGLEFKELKLTLEKVRLYE